MAITYPLEQKPQYEQRTRKPIPAKQQRNNSEIPLIINERSCECCQDRRYLVEGELRSRGHLLVGYRAIVLGQGHNGRKVALKKDIDESSILLDLHHPNIIEFHGLLTYNGLEYMVLDFCENSTLEDMIQARKYLTAPEAREFGIQIAGAIKYLHNTAHITHRGLKTQDILLDSNMSIKITGVGLAERLRSPADRMFDVPPMYEYMAPEMRDGCGHDKSVDLWSFGIIFMKMLFSRSGSQHPDRSVHVESQKLVEEILVQRPDPDTIVMDPFFAGPYLPKMDASIRTEPPTTPSHGSDHDAFLFQQHCRRAGVGRDSDGKFWPCVGTKKCINPLRSEKEGILVELGFEWA